ncbi:MAG TPA: PAS domain-containing sensor histidine kinase [Candidatus Thermoplasmatota archaeon]
MAGPGIGARPGRLTAYRELVLGVVLGALLALITFLVDDLARIVPAVGTAGTPFLAALFFATGVGLGVLLWVGSRRERELRRIYQAVANVNIGGVVVDDPDGRIVFANAKFSELVGRPPAALAGLPLGEVVSPETPAHEEAIRMRRKMGAASVYEMELKRPDGQGTTVLVSTQALEAGERYGGSVSFFLDITQRKRAERELTQAKELAEFFLDLITHDISNINQGIRGFGELLRADAAASPERRQKYAERVLGQVDRSNALITNIKKISALRWSWSEAPEGTIDLEEAVRQAIAIALGSFPDRRVEINLHNFAGSFEARADYLATELFYNLVHNAVKYTPGEEARVDVEIRPLPSGSALVTVSDRGPGIPDEAKESLLTRIAPDRRAKMPSGYHSGTGLTLVRLIAERFGWKVWAENRVRGDFQQGTSFCVEVAAARAPRG